MKNQIIKQGIVKAIIFFFLFFSLKAAAQSTNPNQSNINSQNNSRNQNNPGGTNEQNNNINNPYTSVPQDSVNRVRYNEPARSKHPSSPGAFELQENVRHQSGQNQMAVPPNAAGPDTNMRQIPPTGKRNNSLPDSNYRIEPAQVNPTIMGSPTDSLK